MVYWFASVCLCIGLWSGCIIDANTGFIFSYNVFVQSGIGAGIQSLRILLGSGL